MACLLRKVGALAAGDRDDEFNVFRPDGNFPYSIDVCATLGTRILIIEIDGYKGHKSYRSIRKDEIRFAEIKSLISGEVECFRFSFWQLTPWNKELELAIKEEMHLIDQRKGYQKVTLPERR